MIVTNKDEQRRCSLFTGNIIKHQYEAEISDEQMAALLSLNVRTYKRKVKNPLLFKMEEILAICKRLGFTHYEVEECFCFLKN